MIKHPDIIDWFATGSSVICNPPVLNTDFDYVILVPRNSYELDQFIEDQGFKTNYADYDLEDFRSWKQGQINYIITDNIGWYAKMRTATKLAKKLNLLDKQQRIDLFDYVMYGTI